MQRDQMNQGDLKKLQTLLERGTPNQLKRQLTDLWKKQHPGQTEQIDQLLVSPPSQPHEINKQDFELKPGQTLGHFKIEKKIASGGMGSVYLGSRLDDLDLKVALKTLDHWPPKLYELFRAECKILSGLKHPNIAHLIDVGTLSCGRPWMAMEYVPGKRLDVWLAKNKPDLETRLDLFLKICDALTHAHSQMIIHRDLKPGNIIITPGGRPKLLDFGIATILDPDTGKQKTVTLLEERLMTPEYASPEQVNGLRLSTLSDVYGLGVLLYEMLTGSRPYTFKSRKPLDIIKAVNDTVITRPSSLRMGELETGLAHAKLRGDLDTIVLKSLERDTQRRYQSVAQLSGDIRLYLKNMPITARPPTHLYRFRKWVARNPWPSAVASCAVISLIAFSFHMRIQNQMMRKERDLANEQKEIAENVTHFIVNLFEQTDPDNRQSDITAYEVMEIGRQQVESDLSKRPKIRKEMQLTMGRMYSALGKYDEAKDLYHMVIEGTEPKNQWPYKLALARTQQAAGDIKAAGTLLKELGEIKQERTLQELAQWHKAQGYQMFMLGLYLDSERHIKQALESNALDQEQLLKTHLYQAELYTAWARYDDAIAILRDLQNTYEIMHNNNPHSDLLKIHHLLAVQYNLKGNYDLAEAQFQTATNMANQLYLSWHPEKVKIQLSYGSYLNEMSDFSKARTILNQAQLDISKSLGKHHLLYAECLTRLAALERNLNNTQQAERFTLDAMEIIKNAMGNRHLSLADSLNELGSIKLEMGAYEESEMVLRECLSIISECLGEQHPKFSTTLANLAYLSYKKDDLEAALSMMERVIQLQGSSLGENHIKYAIHLNNLSEMTLMNGNLEKAEVLLRKSLGIHQKQLGEKNIFTVQIETNLATILSKQGKYSESKITFERLLKHYRETYGDSHPHYAQTLSNLSWCYFHEGDYNKALKSMTEANNILKQSLGEHHPVYIGKLAAAYKVKLKLGRVKEAKQGILESLELIRESQRENTVLHGDCLLSLAGFYEKLAQYDEVKNAIEKALVIYQKNFPEGNQRILAATSILGLALAMEGEKALGLQKMESAYEGLVKIRGRNDRRQTIPARDRLAVFYEKEGDSQKEQHYRALN